MSAYYNLYKTLSFEKKEGKKKLHNHISFERAYTKEELIKPVIVFHHWPQNRIGVSIGSQIDDWTKLLSDGNIVESKKMIIIKKQINI